MPSANARSRKIAPVHVYVPEDFAPEVVLPPELLRHADCARYFLHRIIWGRVTRKLTSDEFVPLKFDYLRAVIPDRVLRTMRLALEEAGVIECDGFYVEGRKSYGFRLGPSYGLGRIVRRPLADRETTAKVHGIRQTEYKAVKLDVHKHLRNWYRKVEIDLPLALKLLDGHRHFELAKIPVEQIAARELIFSVCRYGRVHTDLTRCPRKARPALRIQGEPLVCLDIANSQPLFLALLVANYRKGGNKTFAYVTFEEGACNPYQKIDDIIARTVLSFQQEEEFTSTPSPPANTTRKASPEMAEDTATSGLTETASKSDGGSGYQQFLRPDEARYIDLCQRGKLYETLMDYLELPIRSWVKDRFFEFIYGTNRQSSPMKTVFAEEFPGVFDVVRANKRKDHAFLPRLMQNIEANFVINTVCRRLMREMPEAPVLTIHDSVLTTEAFVDSIRGVLRDEFSRIGLSPTLHVQKYG